MSSSVHEKWVERARYDLETAEVLLAAGRYIYVVFMCQQAIEKCFKAVISYRSLEVPPIHNLRRLAEVGGFLAESSPTELRWLDYLSQFYLNARYKEDVQELARQLGEDTARECVRLARGKMEWCIHELTR